ncbi:LAME_0E09428g1_1 [Lachancea meyersii CBS 8951]|uniref:LAME_0E09428g1_1 n=1 Tax=Lachancea meyersii CBS 8951 TaxID=1266667 RepID=A0A1G4JJT0_9SACH|nr:LAME_0E09428g1_1 [Lachancea meyersii CBS 8951]
MTTAELGLEDAHNLIAILQKQLDELGKTSHEYEQELEEVIQKLESELIEKDDKILRMQRGEARKDANEQITTLEIQADELEAENRILRSQLKESKAENDRLVEQNVLLEHELTDLRCLRQSAVDETNKKYSERQPNLHEAADIEEELPRTSKSPNNCDVFKVSTNQSSLRLSSHKTSAALRATYLSSTSVVATTRHK